MALEDRSEGELRDALVGLPERKPTLRLVAALNYKRGIAVLDIAAMYGVSERTIYNWLDRLESDPLTEAIYDEQRPGRPSRLSEAERSTLEAALSEPPQTSGYDAPEWTPRLVAHHVERAFGEAFSMRHIRRLLNELDRE